MIVRGVEGVDRIGIGGRRRDIRVEKDRGVGPRRAYGDTVSIHAIAGDAAARRRPREGDPRGGHAGGLEAGGGGGGLWRPGGGGLGARGPRQPAGGGAAGGPPFFAAPRASRGAVRRTRS